MALEPVEIPKPWGREIWFTGMEARGESQVWVGEQKVDLSAYLDLDRSASCDHTDVLLLKILDPAPTEVLGDLYFELHEEKREVYIVTHIDPAAWPSGAGAIRFGMNQELRQTRTDPQFREDFMAVVAAYEQIRRRIDEQPANATDPELAQQEQALRADMDAFTHMRRLSVGDVVRVPTYTPHALQHGVRVVEFQTQTYERLIISFAQKVLTQDHWDSGDAITKMHLEPPPAETFEPVSHGVERVARFEDFNVWRANLEQPDGHGSTQFTNTLSLPSHLPYAVCMSIKGCVAVGDLTLPHEHACFVPRNAIENVEIRATNLGADNNGAASAQLLIAAPGL